MLIRCLVGLVDVSRRFAALFLLGGILLAAFSAWYASGHLGVTTNTDEMFSANLPWRKQGAEMAKDFPQFHDLLVAVVNARIPEEADATAAELARRLEEDKTHFTMVQRPDDNAFFRQEGLLFLSKKDLSDLMDQTIDAQPFLGQLVADPSARGLFSALSLLGMGVTQTNADLTPYMTPIEGFHKAMAAALDGHPQPLSWQTLLGGGVSKLAGPYKFVLAQVKQNFGSLQPGGEATQAMRAIIADLPYVKAGDARVRITGQVALADEEFASVAQGAVEGMIGSLVLITIWLFLAVHSWRLIVPILMTLILGLMLTVLFAAVFVGTLNLVSVGFGVLFVGIAVDFAIQFSVRYREYRYLTGDPGRAITETARRVGVQILIASLATAAGFLAFVPTAFQGVAELGLIAGAGMLIAFLCTLAFLPAAITVFRPPGEMAEVGFAWAARLDPPVIHNRGRILVGFGVLAVLAVAVSPMLKFDSDPLDTKNPNTEAMRTLRDLINNPVTNPYTIDILTPNLKAAAALSEKLDKLPLVDGTISLNSFIPADQQQKLAIIADADNILAPTLAPHGSAAPITPDQVRLAAKTALSQIEPATQKLPQDHPLAAIAGDLKRVETASDATVMALNDALTHFLPTELDQLRTALSAKPITAADIPADFARDWLLPDGRARIQVNPKPAAQSPAGLHQFVEQVTAVAPDAGGAAVTIEATSDTIVGAFRSAATYAVIAIAVILAVLLRKPLDVGLVMAPLLMSALLTLLVAVLLPLPLNFANIIALPLLLGVGVSFNIYFVMNWRAGERRPLGSPTARAILFSALTTGTAFGSLALSAHPGTASMGELLLISLACKLLASLVFIPALLSRLTGPEVRATGDQGVRGRA
ncbi:MAG TPA: MMPL family transporter [Rhodopila sp.]|uniref:MMPL family transporter n=1 Tax=Rhodopila sp. TaxID=2480087 RepID=UPI002CCC490B|nr:MMPL family transporter [Rhodopila sp.]HVY17392.1 MMPL family transporter [Rhodopila sp.]